MSASIIRACTSRIGRRARDAARAAARAGTVGLLMLRSYVLAGNTAHYDGVIAALEARGLRVIPAFASGLDSRPAIEQFFMRTAAPTVDAVVSLTGFSLVGGPAYNDCRAAEEMLAELDVPYIAAHPVEFQTLEQWGASERGLLPVESDDDGRDPRARRRDRADGLRRPLGRVGRACTGCDRGCTLPAASGARHAVLPRARRDAGRARRQAGRAAPLRARRAQARDRAVQLPAQCRARPAPPPISRCSSRSTARSTGIAARRLRRRRAGERRCAARRASSTAMPSASAPIANVARAHPRRRPCPPRALAAEIEAQWGPAPGQAAERRRLDLRARASASATSSSASSPPSAMKAIRCGCCSRRASRRPMPSPPSTADLREDFGADAVLHFGTHGALEFMPGKQAGTVRRLLAGPADRRSAELLSLRRQQPVRRHDRQAPLGRDAGQLSDAAGRPCRALPRADRSQGLDRALARPAAGDGGRARRSLRNSSRRRPPSSTLPKPSRPGTTLSRNQSPRRRDPRTRIHADPARPAHHRRTTVARRASRHAGGVGRRIAWRRTVSAHRSKLLVAGHPIEHALAAGGMMQPPPISTSSAR